MSLVITDHPSFFPKYPTMNPSQTSLALLFLITFTLGTDNPPDDVSINCGSTGTSAARSGRKWLGDTHPMLQLKGLSTASTVSHKLTSTDPVPHKTARISRSRFSYAFQVNPGQKIIRLHFNPTPYRGFKGLKDLFTVEAGPFILLTNFSASLTAHALTVNTLVKEFCLNIQQNQQFHLLFSPETSQSLDTYAFINGIQIISLPATRSYFQGGDVGLQVVGQNSLVYVDNSIALERIYRLNIKQDFVSSSDDFDDIFGMRVPEREVSDTNNITWKISVDVGFRYLVRLHFSKIGFKMAEIGGLNFKVLINEMIAKTNTNTNIVVKERDGSSIPWYEDYIVMMNGRKQEGRRNILICLQSNDEFMDGNGPLKGFEMFKLSNPDSSLASPNPLPSSQASRSHIIQSILSILGHGNAIGTVAIAFVSLVSVILHKLREIWEASSSKEENKPSARAQRLCRHFSLAEIELATRNFNEGLVIGKGGFGKVYKGLIDKGQKTVAVKRLKSNSKQGSREFLTEIETLSELRHINLVSLIGYCSERREMILVYEYMACGTLADHLYKLARDNSDISPLTWKQRLNICIGAARGLDYLHTGQAIIHRDIKASNILLDENFVAKVSDFGLAKPEDRSKLQSHVSTKVKGTFGYFDPYYVTTSRLIRKSDTYAFGVVLLEVLCGRAAVDSGVAENERILTTWARDKIRKGEVDQIIASDLREEISPSSLKTFVVVAERCLDGEPKNRPTMSQVVLQLELALEPKESNQNLALNGIASGLDNATPSALNDGVDRFMTARQTMAITDTYNRTLPPNVHTSSKVVNTELTSRRKHGRKSTTIKLSKLWPWEAFWSRVKPSKKNELSFSGLDKNFAVESLQYDFDKIRAATNDFSLDNKLGQGGFGSVYKGKILNGQEIAVKRLSSSSSQGSAEFKNEVSLLARLQHRNLVRLLGFTLAGAERLLVYEFVENSSLDHFIFDPIKRAYLGWDRRYEIIQGTARGLLYLHDDSRLRIIHRDLKASNVLLDRDLNPKISDFGMARLLADGTQGDTSRIVGTYGYMSPEYAMHGYFSVKSDVFSFGVLVLEILSGQRNRVIHNGENVEDLLNLTWKNWRKGTAANMIDPALKGGSGSLQDMLRCIHIGLLCVQENPADRPSMASILLLLSTFSLTLPLPSEPAYFTASHSGPKVSISKEYHTTYSNSRKGSKAKAAASKSSSQNEMSVTEFYPR